MTPSLSTFGKPGEESFPTDRPLTLFAIIWAVSTLIHLMSFQFWAMTITGWVLMLAVALLLFRPSSLIRFTCMIMASLANLFNSLPFVPNHILFEGMVNLTILICILWSGWKSRRELVTAWEVFPRKRQALVTVVMLGIFLAVLKLLDFNMHLRSYTTVGMMILLGRRKPLNFPFLETLPQRIYLDFSAVLRWELAAMYFWAVIQKLNWDYFNPAVSCAVKLQLELEELLHLPASPEAILPMYSWGSLVVEGAIPLLLLTRKTRMAGFLLALLFHFWLALHRFPGIYSFSALVYGMLIIFLPTAQRMRMQDLWARQRAFLSDKLKLPRAPAALGVVLIVLYYMCGIPSKLLYEIRGENLETFYIVNTFGLVWFLIWAVWLGHSYLDSWKTVSRIESENTLPLFRPTPAWACLLLVITNGLAPWVGLKTQNSFAMFSNLRTEFEQNHIFLKRVDLFSYQDDMIEVVASEPEIVRPTNRPKTIEKFANPGRIMPFFELRRLLSRVEGDVTAIILRNGEEVVITRRGDQISHPEAFKPPSLLEYKFLWFRRHNNWDGPMPCTH